MSSEAVQSALNSETKQRKRTSAHLAAHAFKPGQSGNPGGRPKSDVAQLARQHTQAAINALVLALRVPQTRVPAAVALLDRGWGRPLQSVEVNGKTTLELHLIAARMVSGQLLEGSIAPEVEAEVLPAPDGEDVPTE
jgi:hypothetical protein